MTTAHLSGQLDGRFALDPAATRIGFVAGHTIGPKVRGHFESVSGHGHLYQGADVSNSGAQVTINAASIRTGNKRRDHHLRAHFLRAPDHPVITFTTTEVTEMASGAGFTVTGDVELRGVTRRLSLDFTVVDVEPQASRPVALRLRAVMTVSRKDWGIIWDSAMDRLVRDQVTLEIEVAARRGG